MLTENDAFNDAFDEGADEGAAALPSLPSLSGDVVTRKLDLACGQSPRDGFEGVDVWSGARHVVDLERYPWPFEDASVAELNCSHYIEHIPAQAIDYPREDGTIVREDQLFAFFDECWRVLEPDGVLHLAWPAHSSDRAFQDPTHRRFIPLQTLRYLEEQWRRDNRLDHYNVRCNFEIIQADPTIDRELLLRATGVTQSLLNHQRNRAVDYVGKLRKKPRLP